MLSINKLLLPLLITSALVAPACYANQNAHKTISVHDEQLRNRLHKILWSHKEIFASKDNLDQFALNKTFVLTDLEPFFTNDNGPTFLIYENKNIYKNKTYRIYAYISESGITLYDNIAELDWNYPTVAIFDPISDNLVTRYVLK